MFGTASRHSGLPPDPVQHRYSITMPDALESLFVATLDVTGPRRKHEAAVRDLILDFLDSATTA